MKGKLGFRILLAVLALLFLVGSVSLSPRTRIIPLVVASLTLLLLAAEMVPAVVRLWRHPAGGSSAPATPPGSRLEVPSANPELLVFAWVLLCPCLIWSVGFSAGVPLFTFLFLAVRCRRGLIEPVVLAAALWMVIELLLGSLLELYLHDGWLWG